MDNNIFINPAIDKSLEKYKLLKETNDYTNANDFLVYAIGILIYIYGEENVLGLYDKKDYQSFDYLLNKYNVDPYYVNKFYDDFNKFYSVNIRNVAFKSNEYNPYFIFIQEDLINMYIAKYNALKFDKKKFDKFKEMLFTPVNNDSFMQEYNQKMTDKQDYILNYYESKVYEVLHPLEFTLKRNNVISQEVYDAFDLTEDKISKLSFKEIENINAKIFNYFKVSPIEPDVNKKLLEKIEKNTPNKLNKKIITNSKVTNTIIFAIILLVIISVVVLVSLKVVGVI